MPGSPAVPRVPDPSFWRNLWRQQKLVRCTAPGFGASGAYWNNRKNVTELYVRSRTRQAWQGKVEAQFRAMNIPAGARVLDIGAGTGTHTVPLAAAGCDVTAVEPSEAMREELEKNRVMAGAGPVTVLPYRWEDIAPDDLGEPFDAVIASYSLSMPDIGEAVQKIQSCSRGAVHLFWFLTPPSWARVSSDVWPRLHGREYPAEPLADCLWQALYEMGIYANLATERKNETVYASVEEAVREYAQRLDCRNERDTAILQEYFTTTLRPSGRGLVLPGASISAHIWWQNGTSREGGRLP